MGAFNSAVITKKGNALLAKVVAGVIKLEFTKIAVSADTLSGDLASKTGIGTIKQIAKVASIIKQNNASTKVSASFSNETLTEGYYVRSIGLYATDPDEGEILYSISVADESTATADWMPPYNGIGVSSLMVDLVTAVANASSVNLDVDPTALATVAQIMEVNEHLTALDNSITVTTEKTLNGSVAGGLKINKVCGKCEQGADPTPEVPQEIKSVEVSDISAYGKNRLKNTANSCTTNGVTFTVNEDGSVTADGTATASAVLHLNETSIENLHIGEYIPSGITGVRITHRDGTIYYLNKPFTVDDTVVEVAPFISIEGGVTVNSLVFKPMIRNASIENDTYEPYMGNSVTLSQPITLNGIGEVMDELTPVGVVRKFAKVVLDGSESWGVFNTDEADTYRRKTTSFVEKIKGAGLVMSDKYLAKTSTETYLRKEGISVDLNKNVIIYDADFITSDSSAWIAYLGENPVTFLYELDKPTVEPLPVADQVALHSLVGYDKITCLGTNSTVDPVIEAEYGTNKMGAHTLTGLLTAQRNELKLAELTSTLAQA